MAEVPFTLSERHCGIVAEVLGLDSKCLDSNPCFCTKLARELWISYSVSLSLTFSFVNGIDDTSLKRWFY